jgi:hypothetical protein
VRAEIRLAKKLEEESGKRKLFPITVMPFDELADRPSELDDLLGFYIPDFSEWQVPSSYERLFGSLVRDLKDQERGLTNRELEQIKFFSGHGNGYVHPRKNPDFKQGEKGTDGLWLDLECNYCLGQVWFDIITRQYRCSKCSSLDDHPYMSL